VKGGTVGQTVNVDPRLLAISAMKLDRVAVEILEAFEAAGVESLLLKGPAMARLLYPDGHLRPYSDVDLLVPPSQLACAEDCLRRMACRPFQDPSPHARTWTSPPGAPGHVDLHHSFHYVTVSDQRCWDILSDGSVSIDLGGRSARVPSLAAQAALLVLHAVPAEVSAARARLELTGGLTHLDDDLWARAAAIADQLGATEAFGQGLRGVEGGQRIVDLLDLPPVRSPHIVLTLETQPRTTAGFARILTARSPREILRRLGAELVPSPAHMRSCYPRLARFRPGGLLLSYLVRPAFVVVQAPAGWRSWRRIQRTVHPGLPANPARRVGFRRQAKRETPPGPH
jgi:hypothetical protein